MVLKSPGDNLLEKFKYSIKPTERWIPNEPSLVKAYKDKWYRTEGSGDKKHVEKPVKDHHVVHQPDNSSVTYLRERSSSIKYRESPMSSVYNFGRHVDGYSNSAYDGSSQNLSTRL